MTEEEYIQRVIGRLEGLSRSNLETVTNIKDIVVSTYRETPSIKFSGSNVVTLKLSTFEEYIVSASIFIVEGYNSFNLKEEFKDTY